MKFTLNIFDLREEACGQALSFDREGNEVQWAEYTWLGSYKQL